MPDLISLAGMTGVGKSTLGYRLHKHLTDLGHDVIVTDDDLVRRNMQGHDLRARLTREDFTPEVSGRVAGEMERLITESARNGVSVINTSGYWSQGSRSFVENLATKLDMNFYAVWLDAHRNCLRERIQKRMHERETLAVLNVEHGHASDAGPAILDKYPEGSFGMIDWAILHTNAQVDMVFASLLQELRRQGLQNI